MQAIRAVVIFMSILLVVGVCVLFYGIMNDWHKKGDEAVDVQASDIPSHTMAQMVPVHDMITLDAFGEWDITLPVGAVIQEMESKNGILFLRYASDEQAGVVVLDLKTKSHLGTINFK